MVLHGPTRFQLFVIYHSADSAEPLLTLFLFPHSPFKTLSHSVQIKVAFRSCWTIFPVAIVYCILKSALTTLTGVWLCLSWFDLWNNYFLTFIKPLKFSGPHVAFRLFFDCLIERCLDRDLKVLLVVFYVVGVFNGLVADTFTDNTNIK